MNESVDSEALVMPSSTLSYEAGRLPSASTRSFSFSSSERSTCSPDELGIARIDDVHTTQHLTNNHFDVLVVDLHALQTVNVLHFVDDVGRQLLDALQAQDVVGSAGPSTIISPLFTTWPSCTSTCFSFGIRNSWLTPSRSVMTRRCLPLVSLPNETVPVTSASMPASFGERASNSSATRGRPR